MNNEPSGVLIIDKPGGWTSHDVVAKARGLTRIRQIGHAGTLDPMATGVLVLCVGKATRLLEYLVGQPKSYRAQITLGVATDTYDADGQTMAVQPVPVLSSAAMEAALDAFRGDIHQTPPAYSAIKRDGVAAYQRARRGEAVQLEARPVTVYRLALCSFTDARLDIELTCSSGTYVRSLAHDLGAALGCGAHLSALRRTAVASFGVDQAITLETLAAAGQDWPRLMLAADAAVAHLPAVVVAEGDVGRLLHGGAVPAPDPGEPGPLRACDHAGRLLAIVSYRERQQALSPLKVLAIPPA